MLNYKLRNRKVIDPELDFEKAKKMKFKESLVVSDEQSEIDQVNMARINHNTSMFSDEMTILETEEDIKIGNFDNKADKHIVQQSPATSRSKLAKKDK